MNQNPLGNSGCHQALESLDAYLSHELDQATRRNITTHLAGCKSCSSESKARLRLRARLKTAVERQTVPVDLEARIRGRIEAQQSRGWLGAGWLTASWPRWSLAAAATACIAIATVTLVHKPYLPLPALADRAAQKSYIQKVSDTMAGVLKVGLRDHIHCSIFRKYPENPPTVEQMTASLGPEYQGLLPVVKASIPSEYRVIMAHDCSFAGRKYVHLTMQNGKDLVSLVVARKQPGESLNNLSVREQVAGVALHQSSSDAYQVAGFEAGGFLAFVVSEQRGRTNLQLAAGLAPAVQRFLMGLPA